MTTLNPYLTFDGRCRDAFELYARVLRGKIEAIFTHAESPMADQAPPAWRDKVMHARLVAGDQVLMGSDATERYERPAGFSVTIGVGEPAEAERIFRELSEGGTVGMPMQQTFWALRFGTLTDRFGIPWMVNCEAPA
jgi:PhnB protein